MKRKWRRYELLLPKRFNDGRRVPNAWLGEATGEITDRFGAVSCDKEKVEGRWRSGGKLFKDTLSRFVVDMPETLQKSAMDEEVQSQVEEKFDQLEIWMVRYRIELE